MEAQFAIARPTGKAYNFGELTVGGGFVADPRINDREKALDEDSVAGIALHREELDRVPSFRDGFVLPPEPGIDQGEHAVSRSVIALFFQGLHLPLARGEKSGLRPRVIAAQPRDQSSPDGRSKVNRLKPEESVTQGGQS